MDRNYYYQQLAREQQAEIEKELRQAAQIRNLRPASPAPHLSVKWAAIGATALSVLGTIAFVLITHAR